MLLEFAGTEEATGGMLDSVSAGLVLDAGSARATAERVLIARLGQGDTVEFTAPPSLAALEVGDAVTLRGEVFEVAEIRDGLGRRISAKAIPPSVAVASLGGQAGRPDSGPPATAAPVIDVAQLPPAPDQMVDEHDELPEGSAGQIGQAGGSMMDLPLFRATLDEDQINSVRSAIDELKELRDRLRKAAGA